MKKMGKVVAFSILALIAFSFIASLTLAADPVTPPATQATQSVGSNLVSWWDSSSIQISDTTKGLIAKLLLFFLVVLMVYSIFSFIPIFPKENAWIPWTVSIVVGILSFLFISADTIRYIQTNYEALGVVLTSILPLIIIIVFTLRIRKSSIPAAGFVNKLIIGGFVIYSLFKWFSVQIPANSSFPEIAYVYPLTVLVALIWLAIEGIVAKFYSKEETKQIVTNARTRTRLATENIRNMASQEVGLGKGNPNSEDED